MTTPNEYRAEVMKITGFALMTPVGTLIISFAISGIEIFCLKSLISLIVFGISFYAGVIIVHRGLEILEGKNK